MRLILASLCLALILPADVQAGPFARWKAKRAAKTACAAQLAAPCATALTPPVVKK